MDGVVREVKVVLLGDSGVGKSSIVMRFVTGQFDKYSEATIGAAFMSKTLTVDGQNIKFQIWDTAGQEKYHSLAPMYYRGAAAAIVVYDITNATSFQTMQEWVKELKSVGPEGIVIGVCGNKSDLEDRREVPTSQGQDYARRIDAAFIETSAKANRGIQELFAELSRHLPAAPLPSFEEVADLRVDSRSGAVDLRSGGSGSGGRAGGGDGGSGSGKSGGCC